MARIRSIKPESFDDEDLCALPFSHRWCYVGLMTQADRSGRMEDRPKRLKARLFPYDDVNMDAMLMDLARAGFIVRYVVTGRAYIAIRPSSWAKHQYIRNNEPASTIPAPDAAHAVYAELGKNDEVETTPSEETEEPQQAQGDTEHGDTKAPDGASRSPGMDKWEWINGNGGTDHPADDRLPRDAKNALAADPPAQEAAIVPAVVPDEEPVLWFPVDGKRGQKRDGHVSWPLRPSKVAEYAAVYPNLDVLDECRHARQWIVDNPNKRKTYGGMPGFLTRWLGRTVNRARDGPAGITGSLKTAGNKAAIAEWLRRRGHGDLD